jgi:hypothetical protein
VDDVYEDCDPFLPIFLFKLCSNMKYLDLTLQWTDALWDFPFHATMQNLEVVKFRSNLGDAPNEDGFIEHLMSLENWVTLPQLRTLEFYRCDIGFEKEEPPSLPPQSSLSVKHLGLYHCDAEVKELHYMLQATEHLEVFEYSWLDTFWTAVLISYGTLHLLDKHKSTLRKLKLTLTLVPADNDPRINPAYFGHLAEPTAISGFEHLEHLDIEYNAFLFDPDIINSVGDLPEDLLSRPTTLARILPSSIRSIVLRRCLGRVRHHLFQLIAEHDESTKLWPRLEKVQVEMWPSYTAESWHTLQNLFKERNIELSVAEVPPPETWQKDPQDDEFHKCPFEDTCTEEWQWKAALVAR